ncbi:zinc finger CCCH domain-containing protein [Aspergillus affinis]|uniref:zinc finger CCCH domain-containing protein n=1 Tax=Aspergillus affinis TaxID=1070780 RepID=UPI0022FE0225|nr:C-x8-C-x5-C-x3-H type zinc finger protein [Aspergillus affinis]KAI9038263.1 C-x8-C-x5-C-x3-H type zinc finger protein [Aspergillus affinis]
MLAETDIQALDASLASVARQNEQHHDNLQNLLQRFHLLLDDYNRLKSDYEEEKESREKYKKLARGQERNPFVLVLVDGDGCLFKEHLVKAGSDGGITAARLLSDSIKEQVQDRLGAQADQCRIMVRIYSNVLGLSKSLARNGLLGYEARSLSPFAASFTRSQDLFDYVDAGDKKEGADYKIREMFRLFADNNQCKHIFFAGCHDAGYLSMLTPYRGKSDRITLIKAASFHPEYAKLDIPVRELPAVFMNSTPGGTHIGNGNGNSHVGVGPVFSNHTGPKNVPTAPSRPICKHFQKGICRYGNECMKVHIMPSQQLSQSKHYVPSPMQSPSKLRDDAYYYKNLPGTWGKYKDHIALNIDDERLDSYCPSPSTDAWDSYNRRIKQHKLCNRHQLSGDCDNPACEFDHGPADDDCLHVMRHILRQHDGCRGTKPCKFGRHAHTLSLKVMQWVPPVEHVDNSSEFIDPSDPSDRSFEETSTTTTDHPTSPSSLLDGILIT